MDLPAPNRSPGMKLLLALLVGAVLTIPLFAVYLLVYDRQSQSETARSSIAEGWGGPQTLAARQRHPSRSGPPRISRHC